MSDVILAFVGREEVEELAGSIPQGVAGALACFSEQGFEFGEDHFDGVEIGTVGGKEEHPGAALFDDGDRLLAFVARKIVEDHDIAGPEGGSEELADILSEDRPVHRLIDDEGGDDPVGSEAGDESGDLPMPGRRIPLGPFTARCPAVTAHHVGGHAGFVEEDQPVLRQFPLACPPFDARGRNIRPQLLAGVNAFF